MGVSFGYYFACGFVWVFVFWGVVGVGLFVVVEWGGIESSGCIRWGFSGGVGYWGFFLGWGWLGGVLVFVNLGGGGGWLLVWGVWFGGLSGGGGFGVASLFGGG